MKQLFLFIVMISLALTVSSQRARINVYSAYVFDDSYDSYYDPYNYYNGKIDGGYQWGVGVEYMIQPRYCLELMWQHQTTHAPTTYQAGSSFQTKTENFGVKLDYLLIGGDGHVQKPNGKIEGYGGMFLGMAFIGIDNNSNNSSNSTTKFAWGARLGCNVWASPKFGIKLQAQLLSISQGAGGGFYFGTAGAGVGLSTYSSIYQFGLGGGLTFKLGH